MLTSVTQCPMVEAGEAARNFSITHKGTSAPQLRKRMHHPRQPKLEGKEEAVEHHVEIGHPAAEVTTKSSRDGPAVRRDEFHKGSLSLTCEAAVTRRQKLKEN